MIAARHRLLPGFLLYQPEAQRGEEGVVLRARGVAAEADELLGVLILMFDDDLRGVQQVLAGVAAIVGALIHERVLGYHLDLLGRRALLFHFVSAPIIAPREIGVEDGLLAVLSPSMAIVDERGADF